VEFFLQGTQKPKEHTSVPWHFTPQPPQLFSSAYVSVQLPPQHAQPGLPPPHLLPHAAQLLASDVRLVQTEALVAGHAPLAMVGQPGSVVLPWQQVLGALHGVMGLHTPLAHELRSGHTLPHLPQLLVSLVVFLHTPPQHVAPAPHLAPQAPQLLGSVVVLVHTVPLTAGQEGAAPDQPGRRALPWQHDDGGEHGVMGVQVPLLQVLPPGHTLPQAPQLLASLVVFLHTPPQHVAPAPHLAPQAPQLLGSVVVLVHTVPLTAGQEGAAPDQPGRRALPWQHDDGGEHGVMGVQVPLLQVLPPGHTLPQAPQLLASLVVFLHTPPQHVAPAPHLVPQAPQLLGSVVVLVHTVPLTAGQEGAAPDQPGRRALPWQHDDGGEHGVVGVQVPLLQVLPPGHTLPQAPQLFTSLSRGLQEPPQQVEPAPHTLPHAPQLLASVVVLVHTVPLTAGQEGAAPDQPGRRALPWQHDDGGEHGVMGVQVPLLQVLPPGHTLPQAPQLFTSLSRGLQEPPQQVEPAPHTLPHAPQLLASVVVLVHTVPLTAGQEGAVPDQPGRMPEGVQHSDGGRHGEGPVVGVQVPLLQVLPLGHTMPQAPQLFTSLSRGLQEPPQQVAPAPHLVPQAPQLLGSVVVLMHTAPPMAGHELGPTAGQPGSVMLPWQQVEGGKHGVMGAMGVHTPLVHVLPLGHTVPHAPQLLASIVVLVQLPPQQSAPGPLPQLLPHAPQFWGSLVRLVHTGGSGPVYSAAGHESGPTAGQPGYVPLPWQHVDGGGHGSMPPEGLLGSSTHVPFSRTCPGGHTMVQLSASTNISMRQAVRRRGRGCFAWRKAVVTSVIWQSPSGQNASKVLQGLGVSAGRGSEGGGRGRRAGARERVSGLGGGRPAGTREP
jgi:hypothetical protein